MMNDREEWRERERERERERDSQGIPCKRHDMMMMKPTATITLKTRKDEINLYKQFKHLIDSYYMNLLNVLIAEIS